MFVQEIQEHAAAAVEGQAGKFDAGETIIHHVANSPLSEPLIHLPKVMGIDLSVTKHVMMLWVVAVLLFVVITWTVRRYLKQDRLIPTGFMNALEAVVVFIRDEIVQPNVGAKWVPTWAPLLLTLGFFIFAANAIGLIPIFDVLGLLDHYVLHTGDESWVKHIMHGGTTTTANYNVTAALETMGMFVRPFALTMRLAANMTGGHIALLSLLSLVFLFAEVGGRAVGIGAGVVMTLPLAI